MWIYTSGSNLDEEHTIGNSSYKSRMDYMRNSLSMARLISNFTLVINSGLENIYRPLYIILFLILLKKGMDIIVYNTVHMHMD